MLTETTRKLAAENLKVADKFVTTYLKTRPNLRHLEEDLLQEARIGLMRAAEDFDPANPKRATFETYAWHWMQSKTRHFLEAMVGAVKQHSHGVNGTTLQTSESLTPTDNVSSTTMTKAKEHTDHEPVFEFDPSVGIDSVKSWEQVRKRLQNAPLKKGRGNGYQVERSPNEAEAFLRHTFGGVPVRRLAAEEGVSFQRVHQRVQRLREDFRRRYPQAAGWLESLQSRGQNEG